ncbi:putative toxin-antitoxin system toxin component, PIN family [Geminocystis sp.]|uniref:putative toxin-antitoxin system toxin component, PIN family n=1 Tax=Geminocystis sp. TaxID=2664100 RepID=UPI0035933F41
MKLLLDTNIWISGLLWGGVPREIISLTENNLASIYISNSLLKELEDTLTKSKLQKRLKQLNYSEKDLIDNIKSVTILCQHLSILEVKELRDLKDKIVLEAGLSIPVDFIITGDLDLLVLDSFRGIKILNPNDFKLTILS